MTTPLQGALPGGVPRTQPAARYPPKLCHSILRGIAAQRQREGQALPSRISRLMDLGFGVRCLEEERPEMRELALLARRAQDHMDAGELHDLDDEDEFIGYPGASDGVRRPRPAQPKLAGGLSRPRPVQLDSVWPAQRRRLASFRARNSRT